MHTFRFGTFSRIGTPITGTIVPRVDLHMNSMLLESVALSSCVFERRAPTMRMDAWALNVCGAPEARRWQHVNIATPRARPRYGHTLTEVAHGAGVSSAACYCG